MTEFFLYLTQKNHLKGFRLSHHGTLAVAYPLVSTFRSRHSIIPPPCWLSCWLSCWLLCCCHVVIVVFVYFVAVLPTLPPPPPLACRHNRHCRHRHRSARRMMSAKQTPTAAPPRWCKLSAGHWNPTRRWTGPSRPVAWVAKAVMMMATLMVVAKVGSRTGSVWSSPPPPKVVRRQRGWRASEGRGNKEGNYDGNEGGKQ